MSGARSASQAVRLSIRCLTELTFQVAMRMGSSSAVWREPADINQHARLREWPKGFEANWLPGVLPVEQGVQAGAANMLQDPGRLGETGRSRRGGMRECGTPAIRPGRQRDDEETNIGGRGGCGARPCGDWRVFLERLVVAEGCGAGAAWRPAGRCGVTVAKAVKKSVPVRLEALGTVTTIASVAIKPRVDSEIIAVKFEDGARVKQGDVLFVLDSRSIETEIKRVEAVITGAEAQFEQASARRARATPNWSRKTRPPWSTLNNAQTQVNVSRALADSNKATLEGLKVQLGYCTIRAPISGRISMANVKVGNIVRQADTAPLATINQIAPIYVSFTVPQRNLPDVRTAIAAETATLEAIVPGSDARATGQVTMVENTVDPATGMVTIRATMPNENEVLWPGTLVNTALTLAQRGRGSPFRPRRCKSARPAQFVFVVKDGAADRPPGQGRADRRRRVGDRIRPRGGRGRGHRRPASAVRTGPR